LHALGLFSHGFWIFSSDEIVHILSILAILSALVLLFVLTGYWGNKLLNSPFFSFFDEIFRSAPFIGSIYKNCKEITRILFAPKTEFTFHAAYVPFPSPSEKTLGLIIHKVTLGPSAAIPKTHVLSFIPTAPNLTVGLLIFFPEEEIMYAPQIPPEQALRFVLSCGSYAVEQTKATN